MKHKILLIHTNGYDIDVTEFDDINFARRVMQKTYDNLKPNELESEWAELSYCSDNDAKLYCNGEDVHIWTLHEAY